MESFEKFRYVVDKHNNVWKYTDNKHFLKITPWEDGEDRRVNAYQVEKWIESGKVKQMATTQKVYEIVNKRWSGVSREWDFKHDHFTVKEAGEGGTWEEAPWHIFKSSYKVGDKEFEIVDRYKLIFHNGHLYWSNCYVYYPIVLLMPFKDIDSPPERTCRNVYTKAKNCRAIWSRGKQAYI